MSILNNACRHAHTQTKWWIHLWICLWEWLQRSQDEFPRILLSFVNKTEDPSMTIQAVALVTGNTHRIAGLDEARSRPDLESECRPWRWHEPTMKPCCLNFHILDCELDKLWSGKEHSHSSRTRENDRRGTGREDIMSLSILLKYGLSGCN